MLDITVNHDVTGWNLVFVGTFLIAAIYATRLIRRHVAERTIWKKVMAVILDDPLRMASGFMLLCLGLMFRIGGWLPWRAMREAGNQPLVKWWADQSSYWTLTGAVLAVCGMALIMWPAFESRFGRFAWPAIVGITGWLYLAGVVAVDLLVSYFRP